MNSQVKDSASVLVVGAGPTGLTLASELLRHGVSVRLVDKLEVPSDKSKALALHARSLEMLDNMGLVDKMISGGVIAEGFSLHSGSTRIMRISTAEIESPYPFILMIPQNEIEKILADHFISLGGKIERGVELVSLAQSNENVTAVLKHADGREESVTVPWLVGCDGAHSVVRKQVNLTFDGSAYEENFALADVVVKSNVPDDEISTYFHEDGALVFFPMGNQRFRVMCNMEGQHVHGDAPDDEFVQTVIDKRGPGDVKVLERIWTAWFKIHRRSVQQYNVGNVFLGGDSAHIHSPVGGQGMNTGMQDVYNLAWKLALVVRGKAQPTLLDSYNEERHPVGQELLKGTDIATKLAFLKNPVAKQLRNHIMGFLSQQEIVAQRIRKVGTMLAVNYRNSPIVGEHREMSEIQVASGGHEEAPTLPSWLEFARAYLPGDHAPDAVLLDVGGKQVRLYDVIRGTKHSLLLFDGKPTEEGYRNVERIAKAISERYGDLVTVNLIVASDKVPSGLNFEGNVFLDPELEVHRQYGAGTESLYLIRPDHYIGFRSQPAKLEPLESHLIKLFGKTPVPAR